MKHSLFLWLCTKKLISYWVDRAICQYHPCQQSCCGYRGDSHLHWHREVIVAADLSEDETNEKLVHQLQQLLLRQLLNQWQSYLQLQIQTSRSSLQWRVMQFSVDQERQDRRPRPVPINYGRALYQQAVRHMVYHAIDFAKRDAAHSGHIQDDRHCSSSNGTLYGEEGWQAVMDIALPLPCRSQRCGWRGRVAEAW